MTALALDIGTTKTCALALCEDSGAVLGAESAPTPALPGRPCESLQDAAAIGDAAVALIDTLAKRHGPVRCVGISSQMHGLVYLDAKGEAVSPLYNWQDQTAAEPAPGGVSFAEDLTVKAGRPVPPGYAAATWYAHLHTGRLPAGAAKMATIGDYVALRLTGESKPLAHSTGAAGMGLFDLAAGGFDFSALERAGLDARLLPAVTARAEPVGHTPGGAPVFVSVGDSQAAFAGAVQKPGESLLVNIGTGSQVCLVADAIQDLPGLEARPFFDGRFLYAGAALCGGSAYALLENLFRQVAALAGAPAGGELYAAMGRLLESGPPPGQPLRVRPTFLGTRQDPALRGSIENISAQNLTPAHLAQGFLAGMAEELRAMVAAAGPAARREVLVAAGNGVRKNPALARMLAQGFGLPLHTPALREEAARGAALFALAGAGRYAGLDDAMAALNRFEDS